MNTNQVLQVGGKLVRGGARTSVSLGKLAIGQTFGLLGRAQSIRRRPKPDMDDVTLARKVETEIFRGRGAPKATVDVNVVDGVVWLRGEVKRPEQIRSLEAKVRAIPEVRGVENLLHAPKTPAPTRADTPRRQQRTRSSTKRPQPRRATGGRVTDDRTDAIVPEAEPSPVEHAERGEGRSPAPFGSQGGEEPQAALPEPGQTQPTQSEPALIEPAQPEPTPTAPASTTAGERPSGNGGAEQDTEHAGFVPGAARGGSE